MVFKHISVRISQMVFKHIKVDCLIVKVLRGCLELETLGRLSHIYTIYITKFRAMSYLISELDVT
jgi:hypothetical protein